MPQNHENTKTLKKKFEPLPEELEIIGKKIVDAALGSTSIKSLKINQ